MNSLILPGRLGVFGIKPSRSRVSRRAPSQVVRASSSQTALQAAESDPELSSLCQALKTAGLAQALEAEGSFTVFAPTNAAFQTFCLERGVSAAQIIEGQDMEEKKELLEELLKYHVVPEKAVGSQDLKVGDALPTLQGRAIDVQLGNKLDGAGVVRADIQVSNGVVHVVDQVLVPPFVVNAKVRPFDEILTMKGWAPEVINGRLAMLGFVFAVGGEFSSNETLLSQIGSNFGDFVFALALWTFASAAPSFLSSMGFTADPNSMENSKEWKEIMKGGPWPLISGIFTPNLEKQVGRAAMVGILGLILVELVQGSAFF
eukprot:CAMPEP_0196592064 /NCGR_PEP_ID=MMETSP1081-20130531/71718_1 /TAXON_ID=36882 /ORGANISM="Pyramimonas amylifera, Strain CCMP720" /LENGTH=316 /DNA_ID=CAMNT_0041915635 /DNA_START=72 /DNA_END=1022 /DNA_ORIENTATION=+